MLRENSLSITQSLFMGDCGGAREAELGQSYRGVIVKQKIKPV